MLETLALLKEAQIYAQRVSGDQNRFATLCSLGMNGQLESFQAIERWSDAVMIIKGTTSPFELSLYSIHKQSDPAHLRITYVITTAHLEVLGVHFESPDTQQMEEES
jgi:hypothetical protein